MQPWLQTGSFDKVTKKNTGLFFSWLKQRFGRHTPFSNTPNRGCRKKSTNHRIPEETATTTTTTTTTVPGRAGAQGSNKKKTTTIRNHWPIGLSMKCRSDETLRFWGASVCERTVFAMPIKWLKWNQWLERINTPRINESVREWLSEWTYEWKNQWKGKIQKRINEGGNQCISESTNEWTNERTNCEQTKNKNELFSLSCPFPKPSLL